MLGGLVGAASLYGNSGPGAKSTNPPAVQASGSLPAGGDKTPAYFWVAFVAVLVAIRVIWEFAKEV